MNSLVPKIFLILALLLSTAYSVRSQNLARESELLDSIEQTALSPRLAYFMKELAWLYKSDRPATAHEYAQQSLEIARQFEQDTLIADALHTQGVIYWYQGEMDKASRHYFEALEIRERINDKLGLSRSYNNIGNVLAWQKNFTTALDYYERSLALRRELNDEDGIVYSLISMAEAKAGDGDLKTAIVHAREALAQAIFINNPRAQAFSYEKMGAFLLDDGQVESALTYFQTAARINREIGDRSQLADDLIKISDVYRVQAEPSRAIDTLQLALQLTQQIDAKPQQAQTLRKISETYAEARQYDSAYLYLQRFGMVDEEIKNIQRQKVLYDVQEQYESEKRKAELLMAEQRGNQILLISISLISGLIFIFSIVMLSGLRKQRRSNQLLSEKAAEITRQNREIAQQNEDLRQSNHALEQFAYIASHDLREPLRTIGSFSTLLARRNAGKMDKDSQEFVNYIIRGTRQMSTLLDDLLNYATVSSIKSLDRKPLDISKVVREVEQSLRQNLEDAKGQIVIEELPMVNANRSQLYQLFLNLINNGLKFNQSEEPTVWVGFVAESERGPYFYVKDNGIGIEPAYHQKIFLIFQRLDKKSYPGTGVGLAVVEKIIGRHRGSIWVESEKEKGTTFCFTFGENSVISPQPVLSPPQEV